MPPIFNVLSGSGGGGGSASNYLIRSYQPGVAVREPVYQRADGTVGRADASALATGKALGVTNGIDVPGPGQCTIVYTGDLDGFVGLTPGELYILGTAPGSIVGETDVANPNYPSLAGEVVHEIGVASSATSMAINTTRDFHVL